VNTCRASWRVTRVFRRYPERKPGSPSRCEPTLTDYLILDHQTRQSRNHPNRPRLHLSAPGRLIKRAPRWAAVLCAGGFTTATRYQRHSARQDTIQELIENSSLRQDLRQLLRQIYDLERLTGRAGLRANARDSSFGRFTLALAGIGSFGGQRVSASCAEVPPVLKLGHQLHPFGGFASSIHRGA